MKIKNLSLCLISFLAFPVAIQAATTATITVTTFEDQDGGGSACSLREAVQAVQTKVAYGGCPAGSRLQNNAIQLKAGTYTLTQGALLLDASVAIAGKDTVQADVENPYTGTKPNRLRADDAVNGTTIKAAPNSRVLSTTAEMTLKDLVLEASGTVPPTDNNGNGGIIYSSSQLALDNVMLRNGRASKSGGAIYIGGENSGVTTSDTTFDFNEAAESGGAIAMNCATPSSPYAVHSLTLTRSLLRGNRSASGAAAIELCGRTTATISASTFSGNIDSGATSAAIAYRMPAGAPSDLGIVNLSYITATENRAFLAVSGISTLSIAGTFIAFNTDGCVPGAVAPVTKSGAFNATDDADCTSLFKSAADNLTVTGTSLAAELSLLAAHGGLTDTYLPGATSQYVKDKGDVLANCTGTDQRNLPRQSGSVAAKCDIGAVELLQATANDDVTVSRPNTDRLAIVDVLANDTFAENAAGPVGYDAIAVVVDGVVGDADATCIWHPAATESNEDYKDRLVIDNDGATTTDDTPVVCTYHVIAGGTPSATATVSVSVNNAPPHAVADVYVRPQGTPSITFNPLANDDDDGDGIYGQLNDGYSIYIAQPPALGTLQGNGASDRCPDWSPVNLKMCYRPPLTYTASNNLSPFEDSFTYAVYDSEDKVSGAATITIASDAEDPDKGQTGGSLDLLGGLILALLGLRRTRKL